MTFVLKEIEWSDYGDEIEIIAIAKCESLLDAVSLFRRAGFQSGYVSEMGSCSPIRLWE